ncbi:MAG: SDR family NAD(P)-dependent oxidoreductase [Acidimicrobiia bacterium]|nr:SDR family NAD(P)-dependent oxidoreductase [Acidimicrobiia bacterium]
MLDGKVAIVTGAGQGLGRAEALFLASLGARVVVNDLGVALDGSPGPERLADRVVEEIRAAGGEAVADHGDAADWDHARKLVELAVETFGDLHVLVNNAGFLRDTMVFNLDEDDWDSVIRVHLKGHAANSKWATKYWRDRSKETGGPVYGRIVNTSSEAIFGNPGQPNYAAAKAGIASLTVATARAVLKYGVTANAICPRARTRMTEGIFAPSGDDFDELSVDNVTPLVGYLASPASAGVSGQVFLVYGGMVSVLGGPHVLQRFDTEGRWSVEGLADTLGAYYEDRRPIEDGYGGTLFA